MNLAPQKAEEPDVNLTPMIDVVFLLLLFFMVSTSFIRESSLAVNLPEAEGQVLPESSNIIDIIININGQFIINGTTLEQPSSEQLATHLQQAVGDLADPQIIISADAHAQYQSIATALDVSQQLGYQRLTLATRQASSTK